MAQEDQFLKDYNLTKNSNYKKRTLFSRVHVEDIANAINISMKKITPGEIFNICDDLPSQSDVVVKYAAKLMNIKNIQTINFDSSELNNKTKSFYLDNKRVKNKNKKNIGMDT